MSLHSDGERMSKTNELKDFLIDQKKIKLINNKIKELILIKITNNKNLLELLKNLSEILKILSPNDLKEVFEDMRKRKSPLTIDKFIKDITQFSKDSQILEEELILYSNFPSSKLFIQEEILLLHHQEILNLDLKNYYKIYDKYKINEIFTKNNLNSIKFLFEKIKNTGYKQLYDNPLILIEFLNNLNYAYETKEENLNFNFEELIMNFFYEQYKNLNFENILALYLEKIIFNLDQRIYLFFVEFLNSKLKDLKIEHFYELIVKYQKLFCYLLKILKSFSPEKNHF